MHQKYWIIAQRKHDAGTDEIYNCTKCGTHWQKTD